MKIDTIKGIKGVSIDTRTLQPKEAFVALLGEHFDGHDFIESAIEKGASFIIANANKVNNSPQLKAILLEGGLERERPVSVILVEDTLKALGELALAHRSQFELPLIGITGSNGKTTVKTMLGSIFAQAKNTLVTKGNLNNHIGVPLTLLKLKADHEIAIIEMGANQPGDIRYACELAKPTITLVNNVMKAHLAGFGSLEGVCQSKGEIYEALPDSGTAVINLDINPDFIKIFKSQIGNKKQVTFGLNLENRPDITAKNIELKSDLNRFTLVTPIGEIQIECPVLGQHNVLNALAASSVAFAQGISLQSIAKGLAEFSSVEGRLRSMKTASGAALIDDTYNANPGSFEAAIEVLSKAEGLKVLVMGDMGELGEMGASLHEHIGNFARTKGIDHLFAVGKLSENAVKGFGPGAQFYQDKNGLVSDLGKILDLKTTCLVKGSRSAKMETVVQALVQKQNINTTIGNF